MKQIYIMSQNKKKTEFILYDSVDDGKEWIDLYFIYFILVFLFILGLIKQIQSHKIPQK